jgi:hypothetical protein
MPWNGIRCCLVTAIRDRRSDPETDDVRVPWDELAIIGERRGLPWWGAVLAAFALAAIGAVVDLQVGEGLSWLFQACYFVGSVGAVCAVRRANLFGPMVQPPLVLAVTVPAVVLLGSGLPANSDTLSTALAVGTPLINGFPTMAVTTAVTVLLGVARIYRERDPDRPRKPGKDRDTGDGDTREPGNGKAGRDRAAERGEGKRPAGNRERSSDRRSTPAGEPGRRKGSRAGETGAQRTPPPRQGRGPEGRPGRPRPAGDVDGREQRQARSPRPADPERRRRGDDRPEPPSGQGRPRRNPPRGGEPRTGGPDGPRREQPRGRPRRPRPWEDES